MYLKSRNSLFISWSTMCWLLPYLFAQEKPSFVDVNTWIWRCRRNSMYGNKWNVQYLVNLLYLTSCFTTKELLRRCFAKANVIGYTAFLKSAEQLLFGTVSHDCFSVYLSHIYKKGRKLPRKQLHVLGQQYKI